MLKTFQKIFKGFCLSAALISSVSCKKFIEADISPELIPSSAVFETETSALAAVSGVYLKLRTSSLDMSNAGMSVFAGLSSDEIYNTATNANYDPFSKNALLSNNSTISQNFWRTSYRAIYSINAILEGLEKSDELTGVIKDKYKGEMKVIRAWYYFYLVNLFGDVPLILHTNYDVNATMPRTGQSEVYQQIIADLKDAKSLLKEDYPSNGRSRPNKWTASALLARVYLYVGNWPLAAIEADEIIQSNRYALLSDLNAVFLANSNETIWEVSAQNEAGNTSSGTFFIPSSATSRPALALTADLVSMFSTSDRRLTSWIKYNTNAGIRYYYPYKYKQRSATIPVQENNTMIRYDEVLLISAEANAQLGKILEAQRDLNAVRKRAGLADTQASSVEDLLKAVMLERRLELFSEWGHRWLDLKRSGQIDGILKNFKGDNWQTTDAFYPIPISEINFNVFLKQNPGY